MKAKEISELNEIELTDETLTVVYNNSDGTGKTSLENVRKAMGVNSLSVTVEELSPHSKPTANIEKQNVSDFSMTFGIPKTNAIESHTVEESTDENGLRTNTITDTFTDGTEKKYEVKDGIGIKNTEIEQNIQDSGISKITLTFTDGTTKEVEVHNGKGIESVEYTPSNSSRGENKFKVKYSDGTESEQFTVLNGKDFRVVHSFKSIEELENSNFKWTDREGLEHEIEFNDFVMIDTGSVEDEETGKLYSCAEDDNGEKVWHYHGDTSGCKGDTGTIEIGTVETIEAGENAEIENVGTPQSAILNFKIPKGDKGDTGTLEIGEVKTVDGLADIEITNTGTKEDAVFNFHFPKSVGSDSVIEVDSIPSQPLNKVYNVVEESKTRVFSKDIELTTKEQLDSRNHSPLLKLDSTETWNRSRLSTSFQLGGGSSTTKGTSQTIYIDTGSSGKWYQRNEEWCVQINAGTKFYIPYLGDGTITILYYNQGSVVFTGTKENITQINNGKYFEFSCDTNDYIKSITYNYKKEVYALQTDNNGNVSVYERLNAKTISATEDVKVQGFSLWDYIKNKISSILGLTSSQYNGNAKTATSATRSASSTFAIGNYSVIGEGKPTTDFTDGGNVSNIFPTDGVFVANKDDETSGIHLNGNNIVMWTPCDNDAIRIYDEDDFEDDDLHSLARLDDDGNWWNKSDDRLVNTADLDDLESTLDERIENVRDNINSLNDDVSELNKIPTWEYLTSYDNLKLYINRKLRLIKGVGTLSDTDDYDNDTVESSFYINVQTSTGYKTAIPLSAVSGYSNGYCRAEYYNSNQIKITYYSSRSCTIGMFSY